MGKPKRKTNTRLPQAANAEEIAKREALEEKKKLDRRARRGSDSEEDKKAKKKDSKQEYSDSDSEDFFSRSDDNDNDESESEEEQEEKIQKSKGVSDFITFEGAGNVNKTKVANVKAKDVKVGEQAPKVELSRREREELDKEKARAAYAKKHAAGETDEAKADLARLAEVRKRRAAAAEAKKAEAAAQEEAENQEKKQKSLDQAMGDLTLDLPPPGAGMKEALIKIKDIADDDFQKKYKLKNLSGNKLAKMKYKDFQTLFEDFNESSSNSQKQQFLD